MHSQNLWLLAHKLHNAENEMICIIAVLLSLNFFYNETVHSFWHSWLKFYSKEKFVWFCCLVVTSIYQHFTFFANGYLYYLVLFLKITLFNTIHCNGKNLTRLSWRCYEWKKLELTPLSERICGLKLVQNRASIDSSEKIEDDAGLPTDSFIGQGRTYDFLWKFRASMRRTREDTRGAA